MPRTRGVHHPRPLDPPDPQRSGGGSPAYIAPGALGPGTGAASNLVHVTPQMWEVFDQPGVCLATSWYSSNPVEHAAITRRPSHTRTAANITEAARRALPLRVGIIGVNPGQRVKEAERMLTDLGVAPDAISYDDLRQVGRGVRTAIPDMSQLCGNCADGVLAISPSGDVWPCVFSRWLSVGNVRDQRLSDILAGPVLTGTRAQLEGVFAQRPSSPCGPKLCDPQCGPNCSPACKPKGCAPNGCRPNLQCAPRYACGPCAPKDTLCQPDRECKPNQCRPTGRFGGA